jgi:hypothetical protein
MPLMHTTDTSKFRSIVKDQIIHKSHDDNFDEDLLYLYYGRPAYRVNDEEKAANNPGNLPFCLIIRPDSVGDLKRIYPFDTGAFNKGAFNEYINDDLKNRNSFYLGNSLDIPPMVVNTFFGGNKEYYMGDFKRNLTVDFYDLEVQAYYDIIQDTGASVYDDRRYTIEIQTDHDLAINQGLDIIAVVLPSKGADNPQYQKVIIDVWKALIIPYPLFRWIPPKDFTLPIMLEVFNQFEQNNLGGW